MSREVSQDATRRSDGSGGCVRARQEDAGRAGDVVRAPWFTTEGCDLRRLFVCRASRVRVGRWWCGLRLKSEGGEVVSKRNGDR